MRAVEELKRRLHHDGIHAVGDVWSFAIFEVRRRLAYARNRWQFKAIGRDSAVLKPRLLTNPRFMEIGENVTIREGARLEAIRHFAGVTHQPHVVIGDRTFIEFDLHLTCAGSVTIGSDVLIAGGVYIGDANHGAGARGENPLHAPLVVKPVVIGDGTWIGERAAVMAGVTLGEGCIVGAGAVVTRSFLPFSIIGGVPARLLGSTGERLTTEGA
ncbi:acyltransferase [bacterium]|nr:MAG: acyltransferase [bacterium]